MNAKIKISSPVLTAGEYFKIQYRLLPSGGWVSLPNQTNAEFTIQNLVNGDYELSASLVRNNGEECPATLIIFHIDSSNPDPDPDPECNCQNIYEVYVQSNCDGTGSLIINSTISTSVNMCSYDLYYDIDGIINHKHYTKLPKTITIPVSYELGMVVNVKVVGNCCSGDFTTCYETRVIDFREDCECISAPSIDDGVLIYDSSTGEWSIKIDISDSNPIHPDFSITYGQIGATGTSDSGTISVYGSGEHTFKVNPKPHTGALSYSITIVNECGNDNIVIAGLQCGNSITELASSYETSYYIHLGSGIGDVTINYGLPDGGVPVKYLAYFDGVEVVNTGYRGDSAYDADLATLLDGIGEPIESVVGGMSGSANFAKPTPTDYMILTVVTPFTGVAPYSVSIVCNLQ